MESTTTPNGAKSNERSRNNKTWKRFFIDNTIFHKDQKTGKRHPLISIITIFIVLVFVKILISGLFMKTDRTFFSTSTLALAENSTQAKPQEQETNFLNLQQTQVASVEVLQKWEAKLKLREKELNNREEKLMPLKNEIDAKLSELEELQSTLTAYAKSLAEREKALHDEKIGHLVQLYTAMAPEKAAAIMEKLQLETVILILRNMKGKSAGHIMAVMSPEKGATVSEKLSKMD